MLVRQLAKKETGFFQRRFEKEFYIQEGLKKNDFLLDASRAYLVDLRRNVKIRDSSRYVRAVMEKGNILRSTNSDRNRLKNWSMFLTSLIIKKTFRQDLKIVDENREKL